jgi:hypothetical protein
MANNPLRTLSDAHATLELHDCSDWIGLSEDDLGCTPAEHDHWLTTAAFRDLVDWCESVRRSESPSLVAARRYAAARTAAAAISADVGTPEWAAESAARDALEAAVDAEAQVATAEELRYWLDTPVTPMRFRWRQARDANDFLKIFRRWAADEQLQKRLGWVLGPDPMGDE